MAYAAHLVVGHSARNLHSTLSIDRHQESWCAANTSSVYYAVSKWVDRQALQNIDADDGFSCTRHCNTRPVPTRENNWFFRSRPLVQRDNEYGAICCKYFSIRKHINTYSPQTEIKSRLTFGSWLIMYWTHLMKSIRRAFS